MRIDRFRPTSTNVARSIALTAALFLVARTSLAADSPITVTLEPGAGKEIPADFIGVSYETEKMLPDKDGEYYFRADNKPLIQMFQTLGIKNLRIGGNTADRPAVKIPTPADIDQLFAFAKAAGVKVIYTLRMREGNSKEAADIAKYIMDHYADLLVCFAIGNEPNVFAKEYPKYRDAWEAYAKDVLAAAPGAKFCGPSTTPGKVDWAVNFAKDFGKTGNIVYITQHDYPGGDSRKVTDVAAARQLMLSRKWADGNEKVFKKLEPAINETHLPFRLEEINSFYNGGAKDVSSTMASALWGLDYLAWWAEHGAAGINFHTGDKVAAGEENTVCQYAIFTSADDGYAVRPLAYALKAFDLMDHGKIGTAKITSNPDDLNITAYTVSDPEKQEAFVLLINKEYERGKNADVTIDTNGRQFDQVEVTYLTAPDIAAQTGVTLTGTSISSDGKWDGKFHRVDSHGDGKIVVNVNSGSAAIVTLFKSK